MSAPTASQPTLGHPGNGTYRKRRFVKCSLAKGSKPGNIHVLQSSLANDAEAVEHLRREVEAFQATELQASRKQVASLKRTFDKLRAATREKDQQQRRATEELHRLLALVEDAARHRGEDEEVVAKLAEQAKLERRVKDAQVEKEVVQHMIAQVERSSMQVQLEVEAELAEVAKEEATTRAHEAALMHAKHQLKQEENHATTLQAKVKAQRRVQEQRVSELQRVVQQRSLVMERSEERQRELEELAEFRLRARERNYEPPTIPPPKPGPKAPRRPRQASPYSRTPRAGRERQHQHQQPQQPQRPPPHTRWEELEGPKDRALATWAAVEPAEDASVDGSVEVADGGIGAGEEGQAEEEGDVEEEEEAADGGRHLVSGENKPKSEVERHSVASGEMPSDAETLTALEDTFQRIRLVTGLTDVREMMQKLKAGHDPKARHLQQTTEDLRAKISSLKASNEQLRSRLENKRLAADKVVGNRQALFEMEKKHQQLQDLRAVCDEAKVKAHRSNMALGELKTSLARFLGKLEGKPVPVPAANKLAEYTRELDISLQSKLKALEQAIQHDEATVASPSTVSGAAGVEGADGSVRTSGGAKGKRQPAQEMSKMFYHKVMSTVPDSSPRNVRVTARWDLSELNRQTRRKAVEDNVEEDLILGNRADGDSGAAPRLEDEDKRPVTPVVDRATVKKLSSLIVQRDEGRRLTRDASAAPSILSSVLSRPL